MDVLIWGIVILIVAALILSGKLRVLVKGFIGLFVEDLAKTPEGAAAVYNQAIEKAQNNYNAANDTLQRIAGQLDSAQRALAASKEKLKNIEAKCEQFAKAGQFDKVELYAQERNDVLEDIELNERAVRELVPIFEEAKIVNNNLEAKLNKLKKDKTRVISDMKLNSQLKSIYDDMNELKNVTNIDKLLDTVKEGAREKREMAVGANIVHNNRLSTKLSKADEEAKKLQNNAYVEELKKKYSKA